MRFNRSFTFLATLALLISGCAVAQSPQAHDVILFVGDGMGLPQVTATAYTHDATGAEGLFFESFPVVGYATTHSADSFVTDSAAAGTALACGVKTNNGALGVDAEGNDVESILEIAHAQGKATGLVTSVPIGHATPAAFRAHVAERHMYDEILADYLDEPIVDVILGGGLQVNDVTVEQIATRAGEAGYRWLTVDNVEDLELVQAGDRAFGFFEADDDNHLAYAIDRAAGDTAEPRLVEMALAALRSVSADPDGFFLMIEGGAIDWASHGNEIDNVVDETLELDATIRAVCEQLDAMGRLDDTLIIVTADHETGALTLTGPYRETLAPGESPDVNWGSEDHTALPALVWARGPGADALAGRHDNTDIFRSMRAAIDH